jgi:putative ABC transport system ATP-binding protein
MIVTKNISFIQSENRPDNIVLENINLSIEKGTYVSVCGPEGSGKTSLILILGLFDRPTSGELIFDGHAVSGLNNRQLESLRKANVGYIGHKYSLLDSYNVRENIELPLIYQKKSSMERTRMADKVIDMLKLGNLLRQKPENLSMLQVQLVTLARAVVASPKLLIADEPTAMLNSRFGSDFMNALDKVYDTGITIVHATSSLGLAEKAIRKIELFDGHLIG